MFYVSNSNKVKLFFSLWLLAGLAACNGKKEPAALIVGSWDGVQLQNPQIDSFLTNSQKYIDTIGKSGDTMANLALYGVANLDSVRKELQEQRNSVISIQNKMIKNTHFIFKKDSFAYLNFSGNLDTSSWYMDKEKHLVMKELIGEQKGTVQKWEILKLDKDELKLKIEEENDYSIVTFHRELEAKK
jgi:hypothetical protein